MISAAFALFTLAASQAEKAPQTPPSIRVEANLVELEIVVTDGKGRKVPDLPKDAFRVREDGAAQTIELFHFERHHRRAPASAGPAPSASGAPARSAAPTLRRRYTIWVVDHLNTTPADAYLVHEALRNFLEGGLDEGEVVALVSMSRSVEFVQQFTNDAGELHAAIERLARNQLAGSGAPDASSLIRDMNQCRQVAMAPGRRPGRGAVNAASADLDAAYLCALASARSFAAQEKERATQTLFEYRALSSSLAGLEGAKRVIVFSGGFPIMPGEVAFQSLALFFPAQAKMERPTLLEPLHDRLRDVLSAATRANITFYTVDARGLYASVPGGDASEPGMPSDVENPGGMMDIAHAREESPKDGLFALAADTGGRFFQNSNDLRGMMERAYQEGAESYLIGYYPTNNNFDGKFRRIQVDLPGTRYRCRTRSGYYARPAVVIRARAQTFPERAKVREQRVSVPYRVELETSALHLERSGKDLVGGLTVTGRIYRAEKTLVGEFFDFFTPRVPREGAGTVAYQAEIMGTPGDYRLLLRFRDVQTGSVASLDERLNIPELPGRATPLAAALADADAAFQAGRFDEAVRHYSRAAELDPQDVRASLGVAASHLSAGRVAEAEPQFERLVAAEPKLIPAFLGLAAMRLNQNRVAEAGELVDRALAAAPANGAALYMLGAVAEQRGELDKAIAAYRRAIEVEPRRWDAYFRAAELLAKNQPREATELLEQYLALGGPEPEPARRSLEILRKRAERKE